METGEGIRDPRGAGAERQVAVGRAEEEGEAEATRPSRAASPRPGPWGRWGVDRAGSFACRKL